MQLLKWLFARREQHVRSDSPSRENRTVMIVTPLSGEHDTLRVVSLLEGWHLRIARTLEAALELRRREEMAVIFYDQDLPGVEWRDGVVALSRNFPPVCLVLLSFVIRERTRLALLTHGGYDVARKPIEADALVSLINGFFALVSDIDISLPAQKRRLQ